MDLRQWGWTPELQAHWEGLGTRHLAPGRVARQDKTGYLVVHARGADAPGGADASADAPSTFARLPGHLRERAPAVGDWVALDVAPPDAATDPSAPRFAAEPATIRALLPRRGVIARAAAGEEGSAQVVAANVDVLFIVASLDGALNVRRIERYLVMAASAGARPVLVLNKADLGAPEGSGAAPPGVEVVTTSAATGAGLEALRALVPAGVTAAFVGPSGVGKSSLVNALLGVDALATSEVRASDRKGRHTTTARHLLALPGGGVLLDTPGVRELGVWDAGEGVSEVFSDIEALAAGCKFSDCKHANEPGCAVRGQVAPERFAAWEKLKREAASAALRADARASREQARKWGKMGRDAMRAKEERYR
ncbi:MAG TPA: ribosome small subunit-dependent GTPase A [Candidatus Thermoplasmatota archaeon]|nr:ribosome small subunit-dependent GTPase A [Candidatus Thermoplasmatota archaeon]